MKANLIDLSPERRRPSLFLTDRVPAAEVRSPCAAGQAPCSRPRAVQQEDPAPRKSAANDPVSISQSQDPRDRGYASTARRQNPNRFPLSFSVNSRFNFISPVSSSQQKPSTFEGEVHPFLLESATVWLSRQPSNPELWIDHGFGARVTRWLAEVLQSDPSLNKNSAPIRLQLDDVLAWLVRVGVAEAHRLECIIAASRADAAVSAPEPGRG